MPPTPALRRWFGGGAPRVGARHGRADHQQARALARLRGKRRNVGEPADQAKRVGTGAARQHRGGRLGVASGGDQAVAHEGRLADAHIDDERRLRVGEFRPVGFRLGVGVVRRDERHFGRFVAKRQRQPGLGGAAERRRHAGHHDDRDAGIAQIVQLFAAAAEDERIAALQAHDIQSPPRRFGETLVDGVLTDTRPAAALADKHQLGFAARAVREFRR